MGIWIRSQDKEALIKVNWLSACDNMIYREEYSVIGKYSTNERAIEVLDEIQQFIVDCYQCKGDKMFYPIFDMPEE